MGESLAVTGAVEQLGGWRKEELVHMVRDGRDRWAGREVSPSSCPGTCGWPVWVAGAVLALETRYRYCVVVRLPPKSSAERWAQRKKQTYNI